MKKIFLSLLFLVLCLNGLTQTYLDYLLFNKCNEYRRENGLSEWEWSDRAYAPAEHHSKYQSKTGLMGHEENTITPSPSSRLTYYGINWYYSGENCAVVLGSYKTDEEIANLILKLWKESYLHNKLLLNKYDGEFGAISCKIGRNWQSSKNEYDWVFCTLTVFRE